VAGSRVTGPFISIQGTAHDDVAVSRVEFRFEGFGAVGDYKVVPGTTEWLTTVPILGLPAGTNVLHVRAYDASGNVGESSASFLHVVQSPLTVVINGTGTVTPNLNGQALEVGKSYSMTAKPGVGFLLQNWTGDFATNKPTLNFTMQNGMTLQANFVANPFVSGKGSYNGLVLDPKGLTPGSSGFLTIMVTTSGSFSAKIMLGGRRFTASGEFDGNGNAVATIPRKNLAPVTVSLQMDFAAGGDRITGTIGDAAWTSEFSADRAIYSRLNPCPQAAHYTFIFPGQFDSALEPGGDGYGLAFVDAFGAIHLTASLSDGTKIAQTVPLSKNGQMPFYAAPYGGKDLIVSWITFSNSPTEDLTGEVNWIKPGSSSRKYYPEGFTFKTTVSGSRYVPPMDGGTILDFTSCQLSLNGGSLPKSITNLFSLGANDRITTISSNSLRLTFTPSSGLLKGAVMNSVTGKPIIFNGVVVQKQNTGSGYFLNASESGRVWVGPVE
jgi:hypothetical protein